ncbi:DUF3298 and DUF4163 domain-containing protein [Marilutibacter aestuarii]|uniref:DUF3298 and DUF4163 domain-containing protein n=1 Tax=Marilutibacter aestuarii TaxID=1706195 RepID=A0A508A7N0_9GAMM|nr:DUF3298 and DUF4163 domain-containing protein [Lysobacter aestuarii]TQD44414.1 DUF3298 and DUF4163 domain-containing protein [Lysobacter aestuarii]
MSSYLAVSPPRLRDALLACGLAVVLASCDRGGGTPEAEPPTGGALDAVDQPAASAPDTPVGPVELVDVSDATADYVVGITYPPSAARYPALAARLKAYADAARDDLMQAVQAKGEGGPPSLYDLSLSFTEVVDTPELFAVAAEGSSYTGGAHSAPLLARFVWLPKENRLLEITDLIPEGDGWRDIAGMVREQLHTSLSQRIDADKLEPGERDAMAREAGRMIDDGTGPEPENYRDFEPVVDRSGRIVAIRFVFPPYQVGPYSDGAQSVEIPAAALRPHVAQAYRDLFVP